MRDAIVDERLESLKTTRLDILAFFGAFIGGLLSYLLLKKLGTPQLVVTFSLILIMAIYALIVAKVPRLRVRLDQAGDNAYYLGLLFTLFSMAVALYEFGLSQLGTDALGSDETGAKQIIGNFGIALGTTIAGIFGRVLLHQMRVDPADVESATRIELAASARQLKATLDTISLDMGGLLNQLRQRTTEQLEHLVGEVGKTLIGYNTDVAAATKSLTKSANEAQSAAISQVADITKHLALVAGEAEAAFDRLRQVEPPPLTLSRRLTAVSNALENVALEADRIGVKFSSAGDVSAEAGQSLADAATRILAASDAMRRNEEDRSKQLEVSSARLKVVLDEVGAALEEDRKRLLTLEDQTIRSTSLALESQAAAKSVIDGLVTVTRGLTDFIARRG